ncbi:RlpA-like double-psi beta-barrel-protein domain-containing protein-containing protein [Abortiporus biennis]|nr:RlpA-like double-psi beta-barrel-protein domain-containing protein-containing protein [Abortiporus biennis]
MVPSHISLLAPIFALIFLLSMLLPTVHAAPISIQPLQKRASLNDAHTGGRGTFFFPGLGACGKTNGDNDMIVAVNQAVFQQFRDVICDNKSMEVRANGKSATVQIVDECPGCGPNDIDLSPAAFKVFADESVGVLTVDWNIL